MCKHKHTNFDKLEMNLTHKKDQVSLNKIHIILYYVMFDVSIQINTHIIIS